MNSDTKQGTSASVMGWKRGTVLMEAEPYALVLNHEFKEKRCDFCLTSDGSMKKCSACKRMWYCGVTCQKADWKIHKTECKMMKHFPDFPESNFSNAFRLFVRLVIRHVAGAASVKRPKDESPCLRTFNDMMSHSDKIKDDPSKCWGMVLRLLKLFAINVLELPDDDTLLEIYGKMVINEFSLESEVRPTNKDVLKNIATAVYVSPSVLNHRCRPNAYRTFDGRKLILRAIDDIPSGSLSDVFITYVKAFSTTEERQKELQRSFYFTCDCETCTKGELDAVMLSTEGSNEGDLKRVQDCEQRARQMYEDGANPKDIVRMCLKCLDETKLPVGNVYLFRLWKEASGSSADAKDWDRYIELGTKIYKVALRIGWPYDPYVGYLLHNIGKMLMEKNKFAKAAEYFKEAMDIVAVSMGQNSVIHKSLEQYLMMCHVSLSSSRR